MMDYCKFWLAKELVPLIFIAVILGGIGLFIGALIAWEKVTKVYKKLRRAALHHGGK